MNEYLIDFTDDKIIGKNTIKVNPNSVNTDTSLNLYGYGYKNYGEGLLENMVHLMENFCSDSRMPNNPTEGQLWYKRGSKELLLYMGDKAPPLSKNPGWRNIIPKTGWDSSDDSDNGSTTYLTVDNFEQYLSDKYLKSSSPVLKDGELKLKNTWVKPDKKIDPLILNDSAYDDKATSKLYVDTKVKTYFDTNILTYFPKKDSPNTLVAKDINDALKFLDDSSTVNHLYIRNNSTNPIHRTMSQPLILQYTIPDNSTYVPNVHSNYAATMGFVKSIIGGNTGGLSVSSADTLYVKLKGSTMSGNGKDTGVLYLVEDGDKNADGTYSDKNKNRAATRDYVDSKLKSTPPTPPSIPDGSPDSGISYTLLPDGTLMVFGSSVRGAFTIYNDRIAYCTISLPKEVEFTSNFYSITVTDNIPVCKLPTSGELVNSNITDPTKRVLLYRNPTDYAKIITVSPNYYYPALYQVYNKTTNKFSVQLLEFQGWNARYYELSKSFDFIAIGKGRETGYKP